MYVSKTKQLKANHYTGSRKKTPKTYQKQNDFLNVILYYHDVNTS